MSNDLLSSAIAAANLDFAARGMSPIDDDQLERIVSIYWRG